MAGGALPPRIVLLVALLCLIWGLQQVSVKLALGDISPLMQGALRSIGSIVLLGLWCRWRGTALFVRDGALWLGLAAGLLFALEFLFLYLAVALTTASRTVVFLYTTPFFVALGAHLMLPGERLRTSHALGLAAAFAGVGLAFADGLRTAAAGSLVGDGFALLAAMLWAATMLLIKGTRLIALPADKTLFYQLGVSALLLLLASFALGEPGIVAWTPIAVGSLVFQVVIVSFASYLAWFGLMRVYPAAKLSAFTFLTPLFGVIAGFLVLGEPISPLFLAAMGLVCTGLWLVNRPAPR